MNKQDVALNLLCDKGCYNCKFSHDEGCEISKEKKISCEFWEQYTDYDALMREMATVLGVPKDYLFPTERNKNL